MKTAALLFLPVVVVGCKTGSEPYRFSGGDGSTCEQAVVIKARDVGIGVAAEMIWMKDRYSGWRDITNGFERAGGRLYHNVVVAKDGQTNRIYFDCTDFATKY